MKQKNSSATRKHILVTAERVFSEHGFDGSRVDKIAEEAGVNKALIYYYFKSKQAILDELMDEFIMTANSYLIEIARRGLEFGSQEMLELMQQYENYFIANEKKLSLVFTESLKDNYEVPPIFRLIDFNANGLDEKSVVNDLNGKGFNMDKDDNQRRVIEFFTGVMPTAVFSLFRLKWCRHFGLEPDDLTSLFKKAEEMTHGHHHNREK